jgi:thiamine-phosphate pyrophosphorylase
MIYLKAYHFIDDFKKGEIANLDNKINIIYRNYKQPTNEEKIKRIKKECKNSGKKFFLSNNLPLACKLKLDGAYIPSFNKSLNLKYKVKNNFQLIGSAHNLKEIKIKEKQGVDTIFLSPIFKINKKKLFLDIARFNFLSNLTKKKVVALGGINERNIKKIKLLNCDGYASITYFKNKSRLNELRK